MTNAQSTACRKAGQSLIGHIHLILAAAALCASGAAWSATGCKDEKIVAPAIETAKNVRELLLHRDFAKLDLLAEQYRADLSSGADGKPNLMGFFSGASNSVTNCGDARSTEAQWQQHQRLLKEWARKSPHSTAAALASASFMTSYGWHARGSGMASTVTDDGQKLFEERVEKARTQYESMGSAERDNPEWYAGMLTVGLAQGWEKADFDAVFNEGIKKFPTYFPFYYTKSAFYSPRWYGSREEFLQVVDEAVRATPAMGETMYARLQASQWDGAMFRDGQADWTRMSAGLQKMNQDFPGPWNQNIFARYACMARDVYTLRRLLGEIGGKVAYSAWGSKDYYESCRKYANERFCWTWNDDNTTGCEPLENVPVKKF